MGSTENGSHGLSYLATVSNTHHGIAIHYTHGGFGILYCPQLNYQKGILLQNVNGEEIVAKIKDEANFDLRGFILQEDGAIKFIDTRDCLKDKEVN